jgi:hypothetical protein
VGWIPYLLDRLDDCWETYPYRRQGHPADEWPSATYRDRVYSCMFKDRVGTRLLDLVREDQVMFECDYPHGDSTWPETRKRAEELVGGLAPGGAAQDPARQRFPALRPAVRFVTKGSRPVYRQRGSAEVTSSAE